VKPHFFLAEADAEVADAYEFYERQRLGLGVRFVEELESTVREVSEAPRSFSPVERDVRRARVRKFPYFVYFEELEGSIAILSVFHTRRRPSRYTTGGGT